ncbi:MAG TPA: hypothetical protein VF669_19645, partial [Tepidisphaeraceae bacterium]
MLINEVRQKVRADLESPPELRQWGTGWLSGAGALICAVAGLVFVVCLRHPNWLTVPQVRAYYQHPGFRLGLHLLLIGAFGLACISLVLRTNKVLGFTAITITLLATILGGSRAHDQGDGELLRGAFLGLDWFVLNVVFTGFLFVPLERLFAHKDQSVFREEWREDLFYYLVSSLF